VKTSKSSIRPEDHLTRKKLLKVLSTAEYVINYKLNDLILASGTGVSYETLRKDTFYLHAICIELDAKLHVKRLEHLENIEV
jgi:hypothetical protein